MTPDYNPPGTINHTTTINNALSQISNQFQTIQTNSPNPIQLDSVLIMLVACVTLPICVYFILRKRFKKNNPPRHSKK